MKGQNPRHALVSLFLAGLLSVSVVAFAAEAGGDVVTQARTLARSGQQHRAEALSLLDRHLQQAPDDTDARVLYGIVLSWEGQYNEARAQLSQVLANKPDHGDALPALINVELWSDHPQHADELAAAALARHPDDLDLLLLRARAQRDMNHPRKAMQILDRALTLEPGNQEARRMRRSLSDINRKWETSITHSYDWYSDGRNPQHETSVMLRAPTPVGSVIGTVNRADRFSLVSYQEAIDFYPRIRTGTYGNISVAYSADEHLYPAYRVGADLFQSVGHGFEVSGGYRHLGFTSAVNVYTFALAKYYGSWLFTGRGYLTPGQPGISRTGIISARHFFGSEGRHDYIELRYSRGASPALAQTVTQVEVLDSSRFSAELDKAVHGRWFASFSTGVSQEQRTGLVDLRRYSLQGGLSYRF